MLKLYFLSLIVIVLTSCGVSVNYLGNSFDKTSHVDVYVEPAAIKKPYTVIGKGYEETRIGFRYKIEKLQEKAVEKAKQKGADAVLFQDYYLMHSGTSISNTTKIDTVRRGIISTSNTHVSPVVSSGREILFLKYE